jgi:tetratricopeptide (TPR) repeat protein
MSRLLLDGAAAAVVAAALLLGGALRGDRTERASAGTRVSVLSSPARKAALQGYTLLGGSQATGNPAFYPQAEGAFRRALAIGGEQPLALRGLAAVAAARHRFDESLALAMQAQRSSPENPAVYGVLGDAQLELGRYEAAFASFDRMATLKPGPVAYARVSYARELLGDTQRAIDAMQLAVDASLPSAETNAWSLTHLANLYRGTGRVDKAERLYHRALVRRPAYGPALEGLARVSASRGTLQRAVGLYRRALAARQEPGAAVGLGDVLTRLGRTRAARAAYAQAELLERRFAAYGGRNQLETALFDLDHDRALASALARAREGRDLRPSVEGEHVLAWALYKNGRCREARRHSIRALRLGTKDVGALYHRSLIERCLGDRGEAASFLARVQAIDPYFLVAPPSAARVG